MVGADSHFPVGRNGRSPHSREPYALARQFVLLDNFYVESEVSADGHEWSMAAYATDFVEKTWPLVYRSGSRKEAFVEWWLGKKRYLLGNIRMTFKNKQHQATYTGTLLTGGKGKASGSFKY